MMLEVRDLHASYDLSQILFGVASRSARASRVHPRA